MKIAILVPCQERHKQQLQNAVGDCAKLEFWREELGERKRADLLREAEVIIGEPKLGELAECKNLKFLQSTWAGTDSYTLKPGFPQNVVLANMSGAYGKMISEYVIAAILSMYQNFPYYYWHQKDARFGKTATGRMLENKTVLILGTGDIGANVAEKCKFFHTYNIGVRRNISRRQKFFDELYTTEDFEQIVSAADIVVGCLPSTEQTRHLISKDILLKMKRDALLINVGRGSLIDTEALTDVLMAGHLMGAFLDVTEPEPLPPQHSLWKLDNVIITPHVAGRSFGKCEETENRIIDICCDNLMRYVAGKPLRNVVFTK